MPRPSLTGNVRKRCDCDRAKWSTCPHAWFTDFKVRRDHPIRPNERYRVNLDQAIGFHPRTQAEAKTQAARAFHVWLEGKDPGELHGIDRPTLAQLITAFRARPDAGTSEDEQIKPILTTTVHGKPFGKWIAAEITHEVLEAFQLERPAVAGNRNLTLLRSAYNWAVRKGLVEATPFRVGGVPMVRMRQEFARTRRLQPGEEAILLAASRGLRPLIVAALETGCRLGELLSLQIHQIRLTPRAEIYLPATKTKAKRDRRVPISSALAQVLEGRRHDPAGELLGPAAYVFGDELGRPRVSIKTAWRATCRRAGIGDLHFHDLRREAGSRWMDAGVPLGTIQRWLGHSNISQTSTYLSASLGNDRDEMRAFEEGIGRVTHRDIFPGSTGGESDRSDKTKIKKPQQTPMVGNPSKVVH